MLRSGTYQGDGDPVTTVVQQVVRQGVRQGKRQAVDELLEVSGTSLHWTVTGWVGPT